METLTAADTPPIEKYSAKCIEDEISPVRDPSKKRKILLKLFKGRTVVRGRWQAFPQFEIDLANWVRRTYHRDGKPLRRLDIRREALSLAQRRYKIPGEYFKASDNWLTSFTKRHHLQPFRLTVHAKKIQDKSLPPPPDLKIRLIDINIYITCGICQGYLCNACTITECMHSFCKSCIVKHVERHLDCPVCDDEIHPTDPLVNIRLDPLLQDVVDRLLPDVKENERLREHLFWEKYREEHPEEFIVKEEPLDYHYDLDESHYNETPDTSHLSSPGDSAVSVTTNNSNPHSEEKVPTKLVSLCLECIGAGHETSFHRLEKKFVRCMGTATIENLCTFLRYKLRLSKTSNISIFVNARMVDVSSCTLIWLRENYFHGQDLIMPIQYRISGG